MESNGVYIRGHRILKGKTMRITLHKSEIYNTNEQSHYAPRKSFGSLCSLVIMFDGDTHILT